MINLENVRLALFDFDDTLCIHKSHAHNDSKKNSIKYYSNAVKLGAGIWKNSSPSKHMGVLLNHCKERNIRLGLISATGQSVCSKAKLEWVSNMYGLELENFCVDTAQSKVLMLTALAEVYNLNADEILLVDDYTYNLVDAANAGFQACTPMEVVEYVENNLMNH